MIHERSNSDFDVKCATIQFYGNSHNSQSDRWIKLKCYVKSPDMFFYLGLKFQVNRNSGRHLNTSQQRLYEFCYYLLPFDLWTSYLARILFLKGCVSLFWKTPHFTKIFNGLQHSFQVWQGDANLVITWSRNPHTKTPIPGKPSKSGFIGVWHKDNLYLGTSTIGNGDPHPTNIDSRTRSIRMMPRRQLFFDKSFSVL